MAKSEKELHPGTFKTEGGHTAYVYEKRRTGWIGNVKGVGTTTWDASGTELGGCKELNIVLEQQPN